jgi:hypothetical protein
MKGYPSWFLRLLLGVLSATLMTGCLLIPSALLFRLDWQVVWHLVGGQRNLVGALHVGLGLLAFAFFGAVWCIHIRHNWRRRVNRLSGSGVVFVLAGLGVTGIACMYVGGELTAPLASMAHVVLGLLAPALLVIHIVRGRRLSGIK